MVPVALSVVKFAAFNAKCDARRRLSELVRRCPGSPIGEKSLNDRTILSAFSIISKITGESRSKTARRRFFWFIFELLRVVGRS